MRARLDKRCSKRAVGVVMTLGYDRLYNRYTHADPLLAVGRLAGRPGPRCRRSPVRDVRRPHAGRDRKSTRLNSSHGYISYAVFCLKKKKKQNNTTPILQSKQPYSTTTA